MSCSESEELLCESERNTEDAEEEDGGEHGRSSAGCSHKTRTPHSDVGKSNIETKITEYV